jgi:hypothetical protein
MLSQNHEHALLAVAGAPAAPNAAQTRQAIERATGRAAAWAGTALGELTRGGYITKSLFGVYSMTPKGYQAINDMNIIRVKLARQ